MLLLQGDQERAPGETATCGNGCRHMTLHVPCLLSTDSCEQAEGVSSGHGKGDQSDDTALQPPLTGRTPSWPSSEQKGMPIPLWLLAVAGCIVFLQADLGGLLRSLFQVSDVTHARIHNGLRCGCVPSPFSCKVLLL